MLVNRGAQIVRGVHASEVRSGIFVLPKPSSMSRSIHPALFDLIPTIEAVLWVYRRASFYSYNNSSSVKSIRWREARAEVAKKIIKLRTAASPLKFTRVKADQ